MPSQAHGIAAVVVTAAGLVGSAYYVYHIYKRSRRSKLPEKWQLVGTLKELYIYPIKSCGAVKLKEAECTILGLKDGWLRDRVLMVTDEKNNFTQARVHPQLLRVRPSVKSSILTLKNKELDAIHIDLAEVIATEKPKKATVWGASVPVYDCGGEASDWFSRLLDQAASSFRLVYYASEKCREVIDTTKYYKITTNDSGAFPDDTSFNLINEASLEDLNTRFDDDTVVTIANYRPNFVLTGAKAYDEDNWKFIKIGENIFEVVLPCLRCVLTTIDAETGVRNPKSLETLKSYRQIADPEIRKSMGPSPRMGLQLSLRSGPGGIVSVNDPIYIA